MSRSRTPDSRSGSPRRVNGNGKSDGPGEFRVVVVSGLTKNVHRGHLEEIFGVYGRVTGLDLPLFRVCECHRRPLFESPGTSLMLKLFVIRVTRQRSKLQARPVTDVEKCSGGVGG